MGITPTEYFGPYYGHPDITAEVVKNVGVLLPKVNWLLRKAVEAGFQFTENPNTGTSIHNRSEISGENNGGFRPLDCPIGAIKSTHKRGLGIDIYDPHANFAAWCYANEALLREAGLTMERHEWCPTWVHLQCVPPGPPGSPWCLDFIPNATPPLCKRLSEQGAAR